MPQNRRTPQVTRKRGEYIRFRKETCERCSFIPERLLQLHVHHLDHDHTNNDPENLQTLCANCHALIHRLHKERLGPVKNTKVVPMKVFKAEHERWKRAAEASGARSFNAWARQNLNEAAALDETFASELEEKRAERDRIRRQILGDDAA